MEKEQNSPFIIRRESTSVSWKRYLIYFVLGVIVISEVVSGILIFPGKLGQFVSNGPKIAKMEAEISAFDKAIGVLESLNETEISSELAKSVQALPSEKKVSGIVSSLTSLASSSGVSVKLLELTPCGISTRSAAVKIAKSNLSSCENVVLSQGVSGIPLSMQVVSEQSSLENFVSQLHSVSPLLGIRNVDYSFSGAAKTAEISLLLFFQPISPVKLSVDKISEISLRERGLIDDLAKQVVILP